MDNTVHNTVNSCTVHTLQSLTKTSTVYWVFVFHRHKTKSQESCRAKLIAVL